MIPLEVIYTIITLSALGSVPFFYMAYANVVEETTRKQHETRKENKNERPGNNPISYRAF